MKRFGFCIRLKIDLIMCVWLRTISADLAVVFASARICEPILSESSASIISKSISLILPTDSNGYRFIRLPVPLVGLS